ncbi:ABC transporter ATP-binding protein [Carboxydothermus pertinax]|uniref:ABC-type quaternary amine transporter n=1 Tax=Carboxydothermus pertinax TaxID=870242 RepID=A0A1L8CVN4_9THEO|nr:ABC transporter ATP-binding protein [Carboxydothermus pertinax]GAV22976.1 hypothetical protein cpu_14860 [Carboxydothermus pertinax]
MLEVEIEKNLSSTGFSLQLSLHLGNEFLTILGPSGAGKSLTLRLLAGILAPDQGKIVLNHRILYDSKNNINIPPQLRRIGLVLQNYALFPHMSVEENIAYGISKWERKKRKARVQELLQKMRLSGLEKRNPAQLSGGQQQRVALARALAPQPDLLLLDEPFSALDNLIKEQLVVELAELSREWKIPIIMVTHDLAEAFTLSAKIAIMEGGKLCQIGSREEIIRRPCCRTVASFTGCRNIFQGEIVKKEETFIQVRSEKFLLNALPVPLPIGARVAFAIRPEDIIIIPNNEEKDENYRKKEVNTKPLENIFLAKLLEVRPGVSTNTLLVSLIETKNHDNYDLEIIIPRNFLDIYDLKVGKNLWISIPAKNIWVWPE